MTAYCIIHTLSLPISSPSFSLQPFIYPLTIERHHALSLWESYLELMSNLAHQHTRLIILRNIILAPITEEIVFRALMIPPLASVYYFNAGHHPVEHLTFTITASCISTSYIFFLSHSFFCYTLSHTLFLTHSLAHTHSHSIYCLTPIFLYDTPCFPHH